MKSTLLPILCASFMVMAFAKGTSTEAVTLSRFAGNHITGIDVPDAFKVAITQGSATSFKITIPKRYKDKLNLKLDSDGTVEVEWASLSNVTIANGDKFEIEMVCSTLNSIDCSGGVSLKVLGAVTSQRLDIDASGACKITASNLTVSGKLDVDASGASSLNLIGSADRCEIDCSGACKVDMPMFKVRDMSVESSGNASVGVWATEVLSIESSGAANVRYKGVPTLHTQIRGRANVSKM